MTNFLRMSPNFILFAAPRCGTTSMYDYLIQHPSICSALNKEIGFFEYSYHRGKKWYKMYFPLSLEKYKVNRKYRQYFITGEATSNYIHHPKVPQRIKKDFPEVKLIAMLRNPVDRAFSQWYKQVKQKREDLSFEEAINAEEDRIKDETEKMIVEENYYGLNYHNFSYVTSGKYFERLKIWYENFSKDQIMIIKSEDFYKNPNLLYNETLKFLGLPKWKLKKYAKLNYFSDKPTIKKSTRKKLSEFYISHNKKLYDLIGKDLGWN